VFRSRQRSRAGGDAASTYGGEEEKLATDLNEKEKRKTIHAVSANERTDLHAHRARNASGEKKNTSHTDTWD
jgi:hypothetical protein